MTKKNSTATDSTAARMKRIRTSASRRSTRSRGMVTSSTPSTVMLAGWAWQSALLQEGSL